MRVGPTILVVGLNRTVVENVKAPGIEYAFELGIGRQTVISFAILERKSGKLMPVVKETDEDRKKGKDKTILYKIVKVENFPENSFLGKYPEGYTRVYKTGTVIHVETPSWRRQYSVRMDSILTDKEVNDIYRSLAKVERAIIERRKVVAAKEKRRKEIRDRLASLTVRRSDTGEYTILGSSNFKSVAYEPGKRDDMVEVTSAGLNLIRKFPDGVSQTVSIKKGSVFSTTDFKEIIASLRRAGAAISKNPRVKAFEDDVETNPDRTMRYYI